MNKLATLDVFFTNKLTQQSVLFYAIQRFRQPASLAPAQVKPRASRKMDYEATKQRSGNQSEKDVERNRASMCKGISNK